MIFKHAISWFEIPSTDINRAQKFYETIFDIKMTAMDMPQLQMRMFPTESRIDVGGAITYQPDYYKPAGEAGVVVYLNANPNVQIVLDRIEGAGGKIIIPKTEISPDHGHMAVFMDSEGNRIALHSVPGSM